MADIETLEQAIEAIERNIAAIDAQKNRLVEVAQKSDDVLEHAGRVIEEARKAVSWVKHAYRVDHNGYIWVWDEEAQDYHRTEMRVHSPEVPDGSITEDKIADGAVTWEKLTETVRERILTGKEYVSYAALVPTSGGNVVVQTGEDKGGFQKGHYYVRDAARFYELSFTVLYGNRPYEFRGYTDVAPESIEGRTYVTHYVRNAEGVYRYAGYAEKKVNTYERDGETVTETYWWYYGSGEVNGLVLNKEYGTGAGYIEGFTWRDITPGEPDVITNAEMDDVLIGG